MVGLSGGELIMFTVGLVVAEMVVVMMMKIMTMMMRMALIFSSFRMCFARIKKLMFANKYFTTSMSPKSFTLTVFYVTHLIS